ncbi:MAG: transposase [Mangrovibacterium sp.]
MEDLTGNLGAPAPKDNNSRELGLPTSQPYAAYFTKEFGDPEEWHSAMLPHRNSTDVIQFITFRLADTLPQTILVELELALKSFSGAKLKSEKQRRYEAYLDSGYGCCALGNPEMAHVMFETLKCHDGEKYNLLAWSIMPNHVHVLIKTNRELSSIVQSWKSFTARWAIKNNEKYDLNIPIDLGKFWMTEYWDRFIRNAEHFNNTVKYILNNPKKAGLPSDAVAHKFTGCSLGT